MAHPGVPRPELVLRIHVRILAEPLHFTIEEMVEAARRVYAAAGVRIELGSVERIDIPELGDEVDVGSCIRGVVTPDQMRLFAERESIPRGEIVVYFVRELKPRSNGCAAHPDDAPGTIVGSRAPKWTLAHELGHVLGLDHVMDTRFLMFGYSTAVINRIPPLLSPSEVEAIRESRFLREVENG